MFKADKGRNLGRRAAIGGLVLAALLLQGCLAASYGRWSPGRVGGYRDRQLSPNSWEVTGSTTNFNPAGFAADMAFYRAAELAQQAGYSHVQILFARNVTNTLAVGYGTVAPVVGSYAGENALIRVRGVSDPAAPVFGCEMSVCRTVPTSEVMSRLAPRLGIENH